VIGGLIFATTATLIFVPVVFAMVHRHMKAGSSQPADTSTSLAAHEAAEPAHV
jgi:hypothetical protein